MTRDVQALCTRRVGTTHMSTLRKSLTTENRIDLPGRTFLHMVSVEGVKENTSTHPENTCPTNDNYRVKVLQTGLLAGSKQQTPRKTMNTRLSKTLVNSSVVNPILTAPGLSQDINPGVSGCYQNVKLKYVKHISCVDQLSFVEHVKMSNMLSRTSL